MINKNAIDTSDELCLEFKSNGVKLIKPELHTNLEKPVRMADILRLPFNVYFLDKNSVLQKSNEHHASTLGFSSPQVARGTDIFDICVYHSARRIIHNDRSIIQNKSVLITEEDHTNIENNAIQWDCLSIKTPWYNEDNNIIGIFGCSIVIGQHSIAIALNHIKSLGLLDKDSPMQFTERLAKKKICLTKREQQCAYYIVRGYTALQISEHLGLSKRTVEHYIDNIKVKLDVANKAALIEKLMGLMNLI